MMQTRRSVGVGFALISLAGSMAMGLSEAQAGVFNTVQFTPPGQYAVGFEADAQLTNGSGVGANIRLNHGLSDLSNANLILGVGGGGRGFRLGGNMTFDFFPDIASQPGIGLAVQSVYYRITPSGATSTQGQLELMLIPYVHKSLAMGAGDEIDPYVSFPVGAVFAGGRYTGASTLATGANFKNTPRLRYNIELGIGINQTDTYVSGGILYHL